MKNDMDSKNMTITAQHDRSARPYHHGHALAGILGPAFVAAVAYVDPGNVAANITSGARYGYLLVWVLVLANCMSVLIQYQSAKLGIVTGKSLPEILGERLGDAGRFMFFMQAEVIAIATDLAEVIGGAISLKLLFGLPAVRRRLHHRRGVDGAADFRKRRHASHFRKTDHRPAAGDHVRFHRRSVHRPAKSERSRRRLDSTLQRH